MRRRRGVPSSEEDTLNEEDVELIMNPSRENWSKWNNLAEEVAKKFKKVKTHQLRKVYSEVEIVRRLAKENSIDEALKRIAMIRARLAHSAGRMKDIRKFYEAIRVMTDKILDNTYSKKEHLENFCSFMEAVVAYHKYYSELKQEGGK